MLWSLWEKGVIINMHIHITGEVIDEMTKEDDSAKFHVLGDKTEYEVVAKGRQAFKDYLFVRKHQQVEIEGILEAKRIFLEKAKIRLREEKKRRSENGYQVLEEEPERKEKERDESTRGTDSGDREIQRRESG